MWRKEAHQNLVPDTTGVPVVAEAATSGPTYEEKYAAYIRNTHATVSFYITASAAETESATKIEPGNTILLEFDPSHPIYLYATSTGSAKADVWRGETTDDLGDLVNMVVENSGSERVYVDPTTGDVTLYLDSALKNRIVYATATKDIAFYLNDKCLGRLATTGGGTDYPTFEISDGGTTFFLKMAQSGAVAHAGNLTTRVAASVDASGRPTLTVDAPAAAFKLFEVAQSGAVAHTLQLGQHLTMSVSSSGYPTLSLKDETDTMDLFKITQAAADTYAVTLAEHMTIARVAGGLLTFAQKDATDTDTLLGCSEAAGSQTITVLKNALTMVRATATGYQTTTYKDDTGAIGMVKIDQTGAGVYTVTLAEHTTLTRAAGGLVTLAQKDATDTDTILGGQQTATHLIGKLAKLFSVQQEIATGYPTLNLTDNTGVFRIIYGEETAANLIAILARLFSVYTAVATSYPVVTLLDSTGLVELFKLQQTGATAHDGKFTTKVTASVDGSGYPTVAVKDDTGAINLFRVIQAAENEFAVELTPYVSAGISAHPNHYVSFVVKDNTGLIDILAVTQTGVGTYTVQVGGKDVVLDANGPLIEKEYLCHVIHDTHCTAHAIAQAIDLNAITAFPTNAMPTRALVELDEVFANATAGVASVDVEIGDAGDPNGKMLTASVFTGVGLGWVNGGMGAEATTGGEFEAAYVPVLTVTVDGAHFVDDLGHAVNATGEMVVHIWYKQPLLHTP